ncbi:MAG: polymerase subunit delta, polymerase subunit delta protein [Parcubacteria group bacterium]|nr:polymerase subunit delta, polymerase subunit delta protein [Parcubacteria group bacterium]
MEIDTDNLHHAYLVLDTWNKGDTVASILNALSLAKENNPDLIVHEGPLGIDEARALTARTGTRPFGEKRVLIIDASKVTLQAQNALLKTLEEPGEGNHFFLVAPYEDLLLPTLRSRLQKISNMPLPALGPRGEVAIKGTPEDFLKLAPAKRLDFAKKFKERERSSGPFLDSLLSHLKKEKAPIETIEKVFAMRRYADDQSSDARLILEHLSLVLE